MMNPNLYPTHLITLHFIMCTFFSIQAPRPSQPETYLFCIFIIYSDVIIISLFLHQVSLLLICLKISDFVPILEQFPLIIKLVTSRILVFQYFLNLNPKKMNSSEYRMLKTANFILNLNASISKYSGSLSKILVKQ